MAWWNPVDWFKGEKATHVQLPSAPKEQAMLDFIDEVGGVSVKMGKSITGQFDVWTKTSGIYADTGFHVVVFAP